MFCEKFPLLKLYETAENGQTCHISRPLKNCWKSILSESSKV